MLLGAEAPVVNDWDAFWAAILGPLSMFIIAMLVNLTRKIEGKVTKAVENGTVQNSIRKTVKGALDEEVQPRLDKIEAGVFHNSQRIADVEQVTGQGQGQHFRPPNQEATPHVETHDPEEWSAPRGLGPPGKPVKAKGNPDVSRHHVPGTKPEK